MSKSEVTKIRRKKKRSGRNEQLYKCSANNQQREDRGANTKRVAVSYKTQRTCNQLKNRQNESEKIKTKTIHRQKNKIT